MMREELYDTHFFLMHQYSKKIYELYEQGEESEFKSDFRDRLFMLGKLFLTNEKMLKMHHDQIEDLSLIIKNSYINVVTILVRLGFQIYQRSNDKEEWKRIPIEGLDDLKQFPFFSPTEKVVRYNGVSRTRTFLLPLQSLLEGFVAPPSLQEKIEKLAELASSINRISKTPFGSELNDTAIKMIDIYAELEPELRYYKKHLQLQSSLDESKRSQLLQKIEGINLVFKTLRDLKNYKKQSPTPFAPGID